MRSKENDFDYRYFPDPDLLPLVLDPQWVAKLKAGLPELPDKKQARFVADYGLGIEEADVLVAERATAEFFEEVAKGRDPKTAANWVTGDLFGALNRKGLGIDDSPVTAPALGCLIDLIADGTISGRIAKDVFAEMVETGGDPGRIVEAKGLRQVTDSGAIEEAVDAALAAHPAQVAQYAENPKVLGFFVGQVMKATQGKANPALVNELLTKKLAVLQRAEELWEQAGYRTDLDFRGDPRGSPLLPGVLLTEDKRQQFIELARIELQSARGS
jgi:aspartyl-tRNA(Asn)/glutamyl-tRNA(Gln) amidotransferase subunit B